MYHRLGAAFHRRLGIGAWGVGGRRPGFAAIAADEALLPFRGVVLAALGFVSARPDVGTVLARGPARRETTSSHAPPAVADAGFRGRRRRAVARVQGRAEDHGAERRHAPGVPLGRLRLAPRGARLGSSVRERHVVDHARPRICGEGLRGGTPRVPAQLRHQRLEPRHLHLLVYKGGVHVSASGLFRSGKYFDGGLRRHPAGAREFGGDDLLLLRDPLRGPDGPRGRWWFGLAHGRFEQRCARVSGARRGTEARHGPARRPREAAAGPLTVPQLRLGAAARRRRARGAQGPAGALTAESFTSDHRQFFPADALLLHRGRRRGRRAAGARVEIGAAGLPAGRPCIS